MELTQEERSRIYEEEKSRREAAPQANKTFLSKKVIVTLLLIIFSILGVIYLNISGQAKYQGTLTHEIVSDPTLLGYWLADQQLIHKGLPDESEWSANEVNEYIRFHPEDASVLNTNLQRAPKAWLKDKLY